MSLELAAHELPKQYDHDKAQSRWYPFLERARLFS